MHAFSQLSFFSHPPDAFGLSPLFQSPDPSLPVSQIFRQYLSTPAPPGPCHDRCGSLMLLIFFLPLSVLLLALVAIVSTCLCVFMLMFRIAALLQGTSFCSTCLNTSTSPLLKAAVVVCFADSGTADDEDVKDDTGSCTSFIDTPGVSNTSSDA